MPKMRFSTEKIAILFRQIEGAMDQGKSTQIACRDAGISEQLRDELFNGEIIYSLKEAQIVVEQRRKHCSTIRRHSSRGHQLLKPQAFNPLILCVPKTSSSNDFGFGQVSRALD